MSKLVTKPISDTVREACFTASVISHNLFDEIRTAKGNGTMAAHEKITALAIKFEGLYGNVGEWETFLDLINEKLPVDRQHCDWESFLLEFAKREMHNP